MASGSSKHPREEDCGPSRPNKAARVGEGTRKQAIVLDDSDDDGSDLTLMEELSHTIQIEIPSRPLDQQGLGKHLKFALRLFDHEKKTPKRRAERVIIAARSQQSIQHVQIKPKWVDGRLNIFFERSIPLSPGLNQYSHVSMDSGPATTFSDVASRIFESLHEVDDFFTIEFALYKTDTDEVPHVGSAAPGQTIIRGDTPLSDILEGDGEVAIRVRLREYITIISDDDKDYVFAITPDSDCTISQIRELATVVWNDKKSDSMRLWADDLELTDDSIPLVAWDLKHMSRISCKTETRECDICAEDVGILAWPSRTTSTCTHEVHNCTDCIRNWIESRLDNNAWDNITCLEDGCEEIYQAADIQLHATAEQNEKYERLSTRAALAQDPNFHWCIGPECENGQIHDGSGGDIFQCATCGYRSCAKCERPWHPEETCEQYTARLDAVDGNEAASAAFISTNTKECPSCKSRIQKAGGCDHMTCRKCRNQFCWICSVDYREIHRQGNTAHAPTCQYHTGNIPDPHALPLHRVRAAQPLPMPPPPNHGQAQFGVFQLPGPMQPQMQYARHQQGIPGPGFPQPPPAPLGQLPHDPQHLDAFQNYQVNQWLARVHPAPHAQHGQLDWVAQQQQIDALQQLRLQRVHQAQQVAQARLLQFQEVRQAGQQARNQAIARVHGQRLE
ncbi:hypothetical protein Vi05172_g1482 [Venturia inaequalis]|nr:hypothetical protein Vi05172_g1482 [Venturia inaequalis]